MTPGLRPKRPEGREKRHETPLQPPPHPAPKPRSTKSPAASPLFSSLLMQPMTLMSTGSYSEPAGAYLVCVLY